MIGRALKEMVPPSVQACLAIGLAVKNQDWIRVLASINPLGPLVKAERALFNGVFDATLVQGGAAALIVAVAGLLIGSRAMRKA